jgi:hypothetical protein
MPSPITVTSTQVNEERHFARISGKDLERIVAAAVAAQAGIDLDAVGVRVERCWIDRKVTDRGGEGEAEVLIVVDRQGERPRPVELPASPGIVGDQAG